MLLTRLQVGEPLRTGRMIVACMTGRVGGVAPPQVHWFFMSIVAASYTASVAAFLVSASSAQVPGARARSRRGGGGLFRAAADDRAACRACWLALTALLLLRW